MWVVDFWHPGTGNREVRIFSESEAKDKLVLWEPFEPVIWEL